MPKYYINDGMEKVIVVAKTPQDACCIAVLNRLSTFIVNGIYIVSERGFETHEDDIAISSNEILDIIARDYKDGFDNS